MKKSVIMICFIVELVGCTPYYTLVTQKRAKIGDYYTISPQILWTEHAYGKTQIWTVDGQKFQELIFVNGIEDSETPFMDLYRARLGLHRQNKVKKFQFRKNMTLMEVQTLVIDGLSVMHDNQLKVQKTSPILFGGFNGVRIEVEYVTNEGIEKSGLLVCAVIKDRLYLIVYTGMRILYFSKYKPHVEKIISSIQVNDVRQTEK